MKNLFYFIAIFLLAGCAGTPHYEVSVALDGVEGEKTFILGKYQEGEWRDVDSVTTLTGAFSFQGQVDYPELFYLKVKGQRTGLSFFVENAQIEIKGNVDSLAVAQVQGSKTQVEYDAYHEKMREQSSELRRVYNLSLKAKSEGDETLWAELDKKRMEIYEEMQSFRRDYSKNNPASYVAPVILMQLMYQLSQDELKEALGLMDENLQKTSMVQKMQDYIQQQENVAVGKIAPDFTQADPEGHAVKLSDLRGKFLLVDFWASWCGPCRKENPNVVAVYNDYKDKGFDVLGVSLDKSKDDWLKAVEEDQLSWTQVSDLKSWKNEVAQQYVVKSVPSNFLLDKDGVIIAKNLRGDELRAKIAELLD